MTPAQQLRHLRDAAGLSQQQMAARLPWGRAALGHFETGARPVPDGLVQMYEQIALERSGWNEEASGDLDTVLTSLGRADVNRRQFLITAAYSAAAATALPLATAAAALPPITPDDTPRIGSVQVEAIRGIVDAFTAADEKIGGAAGRTAVAEFVASDIAAYTRARTATDAVRAQLFAACAEAVYLAGWKCHDAGMDGAAQRYFYQALRLANEADPAGHAAYVLRIQCHQGLDLDQPRGCLDKAQGALERTRDLPDPHTRALFVATLARAHAANGDRRATLAAINEAEALLALPGERVPRWAALWGPPVAQVHSHTAKALRKIGDLAGAEEKHTHAASGWDQATHPRIWAISRALVACDQFDQGRIAEAQHSWNLVLPHFEGIRSARIDKFRATASAHLNTR